MGIGERWEECELSSVDSSILCVVFSLRGNILPTRKSGTSRQKFTSAWTDPDVQWRQDVLEWDALPNQAFFECHLGALLRIDAGIPRGDRFATHLLDASSRGACTRPKITSLRIEYISLNDVRLQKVS